MDIMQYISVESLIMLPVLYIVGIILKKTPLIKDWTIPYCLILCGIGGGCALFGFNFQGVVQGVLCTGVTVLSNQLVKQTSDKRE